MQEKQNKIFTITGHAAMIVLLAFSAIFFIERCTFLDPAAQIFEMINEKGFKVYVERYSMIINQVFPYLAIKAGLPLYHIMMTYSVSFVLIYCLCFAICIYAFKDPTAAFAIACVPIIVREAFIHSISETWLSIAYGSLFFAWIRYNVKRKNFTSWYVFFPIAFLIIIINYFIHPVTFFILIFSLIFITLYYKRWLSLQLWFMFFLLSAIFGYKFLFPSAQYEQSTFSNLKNFHAILPIIFKESLFKFFSSQLLKIYLCPIIIWIVSCLLLYLNQQKVTALFVFFWLPVFWLIVLITFAKGESIAGMESRFMPLIFFSTIPFFISINALNKKIIHVASFFIILILIYGFSSLASAIYAKYTIRLHYFESILQKNANLPNKKFWIREENLNKNKGTSTWGTSIETILLTSLQGKDSSKTLFVEERGVTIEERFFNETGTFFFVAWWLYYDQRNLNPAYFDIGDNPYHKILEYQE